MTTAETRVGMPLADYLQQACEQPFELIDGERIEILPTVYGHTIVLAAIYKAVLAYLAWHDLGDVTVETIYIRTDAYDENWVTGSHVPDLIFVAKARITAYKEATPDWRDRPLALVPDFVVEVVSPNDRVSALDARIDAYLSDGVRLVWVIDPQRRKATIHTPASPNPVVLRGDAMLDSGAVLPGFRLPLPQLFA